MTDTADTIDDLYQELAEQPFVLGMIGEGLAAGALVIFWILVVAATGWTVIVHETVPLTLQALALVGGTALLSYALRDWSGGHVNPLMTFAIGMAGRQHWRPAIAYSIGHIAGAIIGLTLIIAFAPDSPVFPVTDARVIAEFIAAAAVIATAVALRNEAAIDAALGTGAVLAVIYWVSGGQTLANPAITLAQGVFGYGLSLSHAGPIVAAQFLGALSGYNAAKLLWP